MGGAGCFYRGAVIEPSDEFNGSANQQQQLDRGILTRPPPPCFASHSISIQNHADGGGAAEEIDFDFKMLANFLTEEGQYGEWSKGSSWNVGTQHTARVGRAALIPRNIMTYAYIYACGVCVVAGIYVVEWNRLSNHTYVERIWFGAYRVVSVGGWWGIQPPPRK